jgi:hypothetical protein
MIKRSAMATDMNAGIFALERGPAHVGDLEEIPATSAADRFLFRWDYYKIHNA